MQNSPNQKSNRLPNPTVWHHKQPTPHKTKKINQTTTLTPQKPVKQPPEFGIHIFFS
jgi:hypothetical protein